MHGNVSLCLMHPTLKQVKRPAKELEAFTSLVAAHRPFWLWKAEVHDIKIDAVVHARLTPPAKRLFLLAHFFNSQSGSLTWFFWRKLAFGHLVFCKFCNKFLNDSSYQSKNVQGRTVWPTSQFTLTGDTHYITVILQRTELPETPGSGVLKLFFLSFSSSLQKAYNEAVFGST